MTSEDRPYYTIGHSTRTIPEFVTLLQEAGIELLVNVRTVPRSRMNPQFNKEALPGSLAEHGIGYEHIAELGGLRGRRRTDQPSPNGYWENDSFRNYADHALSDAFQSGLARLVMLGGERTTALMCAEAVWWRCHRRIIADYLLAAGHAVFHILGAGHIDRASLSLGARIVDEGVVYPAAEDAAAAER